MKHAYPVLLLSMLALAFWTCDNEPEASDQEYSLHENITITVFWIGEEGGVENGFIPNLQSAWDDHWQDHYGGVDDPSERNGYAPAAFTPQENPFYFALPYNDFNSEGDQKSTASDIIPWANEQEPDALESFCKNHWIKIMTAEKTAYAQWEDVGPFGEDDQAYVFGQSTPENEINQSAGLDLSPAVRDYLETDDIDRADWIFVNEEDVAEGPWKETITTSQISWD